MYAKEKMDAEADASGKAQKEQAPWWLAAFNNKEGSSLELYRLNPQYFTMQKYV